jgi:hypothetical protein
MKDLGLPQLQPIPLMCDNQSCILLLKTTKDHKCTKRIDIKYHYLWEKVARLKIEFKYCPREQMLADVLTKALPKPKHHFCVEGIGLTISNPIKDRDLLRYNSHRHTHS